MWLQFFSQNFHFAVHLFAALVCMAIAWLYLDAWKNKHSAKELCKWLGFGFVALAFLIQATQIEQTVLGASLLGNLTTGIFTALRIIGYALIIVGQVIDPLQAIPKNIGLQLDEAAPSSDEPKPDAETPQPSKVTGGLAATGSIAAKWLLPIGSTAIAILYWRRATTGLERHYKPMAYGFFLLALSDLVALAALLRTTDDPVLYSWVAAFGWIWMLEQILLLAGMLVMGHWVWGYLTKRFFSQLFIVSITITVIVFFVVTVSFTALLLRSIRENALANLTTASSVLNYAVRAKQAETKSGAEQIANSANIASAIQAKDTPRLAQLTKDYLVDKKQTSLIVTSASGQVLLRAQDSAERGDSVASDSVVRRSLLGAKLSTVTAYQGVSSPSIVVRSAVPVRGDDGTIVGSVITGLDLDSAFVDGLKQATGLQSSIYAGTSLAATTVVSSDGKTRSSGIQLKDKTISETVLKSGKTYAGEVSVQNRSLLGAFQPLKDVDNGTIGMLAISQPTSTILNTAGKSIELTFLLTALLLIISIVPIYFVTRAIESQLE